mmetsp:Transcript_59965/g.111194  ORF Transcript_59965/g.111194 Transcript_59965/m.111194 type:complete len:316 (-) Transcript_59965:105-1052(-)
MHWLGRDPDEVAAAAAVQEHGFSDGVAKPDKVAVLPHPLGQVVLGASGDRRGVKCEVNLADACTDVLSGSEPSTPSSGMDSWVKGQSSDRWSCSSEEAMEAGVLIIFDWDDSLCPTTACGDLNRDIDSEDAWLLDNLGKEAAACLEKAMQVANKVVIVTNAGEGWVEASSKRWLPRLVPLLEQVEVISAKAAWQPKGVTSPTGWKARAFESLAFMEEEEDGSEAPLVELWKDIIVIGDAAYEHDALQRISNMASPDSGYRRLEKCRCKSVRLFPKPSLACMSAQFSMLARALEALVASEKSAAYNVFRGAEAMKT